MDDARVAEGSPELQSQMEFKGGLLLGYYLEGVKYKMLCYPLDIHKMSGVLFAEVESEGSFLPRVLGRLR